MTVYRVVVLNDCLNSVPLVADVINRACGVPLAEAVTLTRQVDSEGQATVGLAETRQDAETVAARLVGFGLHARIEANRE
ncbi:ATP-dependent Clp protease adaptor ClpS [Kutzneria kofuensis]|uniref:ATP-dependent Clp protease adapter protein ClpS n=1 Tax=Kutzneria kofuensis TaxID=103725 RepID=A0A7W9NG72_9PSEU|nr:ATP-dependent Clp protease adaptor ClpS [Kutzneria kofuensis]MBB5891189.1 ATP-dependent Clp protease adapter protein ClpS [Kutzneria kofuensis]